MDRIKGFPATDCMPLSPPDRIRTE